MFKRGAVFFVFITLGLLLTACSEETTRVDAKSVFSDEYDDELTVSFFHLDNQEDKSGESIFIQTPEGETILIDAGVPASGPTVDDYLNDLGIEKIDYVMPSHPHIDHIGGLFTIFDTKEIGKVVDVNLPHGSGTYKNYINLIETKDITHEHLDAGDEFDFGDNLKMEVFNPAEGFSRDDFSEKYDKVGAGAVNNESHVMKLIYGETSFLFTGDIYRAKESELIEEYGDELQSDVLVVPHHGGATSSSVPFIEAVDPDYALIPSNVLSDLTVIDKYENHGTEVYHTGLDGNVLIASDGEELKIVREKSRGNEENDE